MLYKASLHVHTSEDPCDGIDGKKIINYNAKELIDEAHKKGFKIIAITLHDKFFYNDEIKKYAESKGIFLVPGIEITLYNRHILILGANKDTEKIKSWNDLYKYRKKYPHSIIIAAHPMRHIGISKKTMIKQAHLFDGYELSWFDVPFNFLIRSNVNKKIKIIATKLDKICISTADVHHLYMLDASYLYVDIDGNITYSKFKEALLSNRFINIECNMKYRKRLKVITTFIISNLKYEYNIKKDMIKKLKKIINPS